MYTDAHTSEDSELPTTHEMAMLINIKLNRIYEYHSISSKVF